MKVTEILHTIHFCVVFMELYECVFLLNSTARHRNAISVIYDKIKYVIYCNNVISFSVILNLHSGVHTFSRQVAPVQ